MTSLDRCAVRLEAIHTYIENIDLPHTVCGTIYRLTLPEDIEPFRDVYAFEPENRDKSVFNLFPFLRPRNEFDLLSGDQYPGEVNLFTLFVKNGSLSLSTSAKCRVLILPNE